MRKVAEIITKRYKLVLILSLVVAIACLAMTLIVKVNYNLVEYLPSDADSTRAIKIMRDEFGSGIPNADFYMPDIDLQQAVSLKERLREIPGVQAVYWLDDSWDISKPLELAPSYLLNNFYKDNGARFIVTASTADSLGTTAALQALAGKNGAVSGDLVNLAAAQKSSADEIMKIFWLILPTALIILALATTSFVEPVLLLLCILFAVLLNMGTNIFFKNISFLTNSVAPILQMAVSMDYAIFLLHKYESYKQAGMGDREALIAAVPKASVAVLSSSLTTIFGFLALLFMRFRIGADLGIVLAKGVLFSLLSVIIFFPALIMLTGKLIFKLQHRPLLPKFNIFSKVVLKLRLPFLILVFLLAVPAYLAQSNLDFRYGMDGLKDNSREAHDREVITEAFGKAKQLAVVVPRGNLAKENELEQKLQKIPEITSIISYNNQVSRAIPQDFVPLKKLSQLLSPHYARLILTTSMPAEGKKTFEVMSRIKAETKAVFGDSATVAGEAASMLDMRNTVSRDTLIVNGLAILAIGLVLVAAFRSWSIPLMLLLTIESSIWINLAVPYFEDLRLSFIGYLVISTVQLGATVDYGILFVQNYIELRQKYSKRQALLETVRQTAPSLLPPAMILIAAGIFLSTVSSMDIIRELGTVLARGAFLSLLNVLVFLPGFLYYFDRFARVGFIGRKMRNAYQFKK